MAVEGQIEGSIHMGLGQALMEEMDYLDGALSNGNLLDYRMPTSSQMPELDVSLVESIDPEGPFGAKECGEGGLAPILPAVANALYDAVGVEINKLPRLLTWSSPHSSGRHARRGRPPEPLERPSARAPIPTQTSRDLMELPAFQYHAPTTPEGVVALTQHAGDVDIVAGGTDLLPNYKNRLNPKKHVIALAGVAHGLCHSSERDACLGALTRPIPGVLGEKCDNAQLSSHFSPSTPGMSTSLPAALISFPTTRTVSIQRSMSLL